MIYNAFQFYSGYNFKHFPGRPGDLNLLDKKPVIMLEKSKNLGNLAFYRLGGIAKKVRRPNQPTNGRPPPPTIPRR